MEDGCLELKRGKRRRLTKKAINKQLKLYKTFYCNSSDNIESHRFAKHHALDCGNPNCGVCGNPRRIHKEKTLQEKKFFEAKIDDTI